MGRPTPDRSPGAQPSKVYKACAYKYTVAGDPEPRGCGFVDSEDDVMTEHYFKQHKLFGSELTEDDRRAQILASCSNEPVQCPWCFDKMKEISTRYFLDNGKLDQKRRCPTCKKEMMAASMTIINSGPYEFGCWVGTYRGFWKIIDHDKWILGLKKLYPRLPDAEDERQPMKLFWDGYGLVRPEFAEKRKIAQAMRDAEKVRQVATKDADDPDEGGR